MALSKNFELGNFASGLDVNNSTGAITNINLNTDAITEGSNLYYTDARVNTFAGGGSLATVTTSGDVTVGGNLIVNGSTTTINSTTLDVDDINITVAKGAANAGAANGAGLTIEGANATLTYVSASDRFAMNKSLATNLIGNVTGTVSDISNHLLDEDNFATDSATKAPSQQSVKAYITSQLSTQDNTDELTEGSTNLFFTNERVDDRVNALIVGGSNITATYDDAAGTLTIDGAAGYTTSSFNTDLAAKTTDNITEGSSNLYHTNSRADARIAAASIGALSDVTVSSVTSGQVLKWNGSAWVNQADAGGIALSDLSVGSESSASGNGAIAYNNSTGVFTYTPPTVTGLGLSNTDNLSEGSSNLYYTDARFDTRLSAKTTANLTEGSNLYYTDARVQTYLGGGSATNILTSGNITVGGNLTVNGTTTTISTTNTVVEDALIELGTGTSGTPANDSGIVIERGSEANAFIGFDESADKFIVGTGTFTGASTGNLTITTGTLLANVEGNVTGNVTGTVSSLSNFTSDNLGEGSSNLYYTTARHNSDFDTRLGTKDTGSLSEGSNLYYTDARVKASTLTAGSLRGSINNATVQYGNSYTGTPAQGSFFFDSLNSKLKVYTGSAFVDAVPAGGGGGGGGATDANTTFRNHTYDVASTTNALSGKDSITVTAGDFVIGYKYEIISAGNTSFTGIGSADNNVGTQFTATGAGTGTGTAGHVLNYTTTGNQNIVVFRNGVKQVEGSSDDYVATSGTSINFTYNLLNGDVIDVQIYELLTNSAYYLKTETYTQTQVNSQISTGVSSYLPLAGGTLTGDVSHGDNVKAKFGGGSDLEIYYDGTDGYIRNHVGGQIITRARTSLLFQTNATNGGADTAMRAVQNGAVELYWDNDKKLETTTNGIDVIGVGSNFKSASYNILNLQTDTDDNGSSDDGIFKITNGSSGTTKAEFRWDESEDTVQIAYGDHGRNIVIKSNGNVGINASTPQCGLNIFGESTSNWADSDSMYGKDHPAFLKITNGQETVGVESGIVMRSKTSGAGVWSMYAKQTANYLADLHFRGRNAGTTSAVRLTLKSDGKVGIGTTSPGQKLTVAGGVESTSGQGSVAFYSTTAGSYNQQNGTGGTAWSYGSTGGNSAPNTAASTTFGLHHWNGSAWSNPLNVATDGNIGIGVPYGYGKLSIGGGTGGGNIPANTSILFGSSDNRNIQFLGQTANGNEGTIGAWNGVYNFQSSKIVFNKPAGNLGEMLFYTNAGAGPVLRVAMTNHGRVVFSPSGVADGQGVTTYANGANGHYVSCTGTANYWITNHGVASATGVLSTFYNNGTYCGGINISSTNVTSYVSASDYRLKENVVPMTGATERLKQLNPVTFDWKNSGESSEGFIAHEVGAVVPISTTGTKDEVYDEEGAADNPKINEGDPKYQSVDPAKLVPLLVKTIQELEARITQLESA